jgi:ribonuclease R
MEFTAAGVLVDTQFVKSAIRVTRRFAYEEVMPLIRDRNAPARNVTPVARQLLRDMHELAMTLRRRRLAAGSLDLNLPEVKLDFDRDGRVCGAHEVEHDESHQIIEEFMLAANIAVATRLNDLKVGFLRRVHAEPDSLKLQAFAKFVASLGFEVGEPHPRPRHADRKSTIKIRKSRPTPFDQPMVVSKAALRELLKEVRGQPEEHAINYALLRSLRQAEYSGIPIGHYALAVSEYCHFTSPIRRYPDLTVHRLFDEFIVGEESRAGTAEWTTKKSDTRHARHGLSDAELEILGAHCSETERRAAQAERELIRVKLLAYMAERIGEEFEARITGVERFGLFCRGVAIPVEGFIHVSTLAEVDFFDFDAASICFVGRQTGRVLRLGDQVRVQVAFVQVDRRELDFRLAGTRSADRPVRNESRYERRAPPNSSRSQGKGTDSRKSRRRGH